MKSKTVTSRPLSRRTVLKGVAGASAVLATPHFFVRPAKAAKRQIKFGLIPAYSFGMYWLAQDQGYLADRDIELDIKVFPSGPPGIEAMVGGSIDVLTVGSVPPLAAMARNVADFREFSVCGDATPLFVVVGAPGLNAIEDLEGKRIAVTSGSNFDFFLDSALASAGLADMPITRVNMEPIEGQAAFVAGAVDACVPLATSRALIFEARPDAVMTVDGGKLPEDFPSIMDVIMTTQPYMDANEAMLVDLVAAFHGPTVAFQRNENDKAIDAMLRWQQGMGNAKVTREQVAEIFNGWGYLDTAEIKDLFAKGLLLNSARVQAEFLVNKGKLDAMPDVDALVSDQIVKQI